MATLSKSSECFWAAAAKKVFEYRKFRAAINLARPTNSNTENIIISPLSFLFLSPVSLFQFENDTCGKVVAKPAPVLHVRSIKPVYGR